MARGTSNKGRSLKIGGVSFRPGDKGAVELPIGYRIDHERVTMPVIVRRGKKPGPRLCVSAGVHGDEINGVETVRQLIRLRLLDRLRGDLVAVPVVNVPAFLARSRYLPDRRDLNRVFPGSQTGSLGARVARAFVDEVAKKCTHFIDLHTGAVNRPNLPQIRVTDGCAEDLDLARAFGAPVIIKCKTRKGSLRATLRRKRKPVIMFEGGEALRLGLPSVRFGLRGVLSVMRHLGMLPREKGGESAGGGARVVISTSTHWERAPSGGIFSPTVRLGTAVTEGETLGTVSDPFGDRITKVSSSIDGIVIGRTNQALADEGDAVFHVAVTKNPARDERAIRRSRASLAQEAGLTAAGEPVAP